MKHLHRPSVVGPKFCWVECEPQLSGLHLGERKIYAGEKASNALSNMEEIQQEAWRAKERLDWNDEVQEKFRIRYANARAISMKYGADLTNVPRRIRGMKL